MNDDKPVFNKFVYEAFIEAKNHFESFDAFVYALNRDVPEVAPELYVYAQLSENSTLYFCQAWYNGFELEEDTDANTK